ncbi:proline-rich protein 2 [Astyanax mexicanus]|uniref:proline-rich protein 2 n=1 Tax=Astyanax mexicanus TaxID=7994 RepID=UPI0020CABF20|nr:proline-rich protein 2 [Astyanax mexicanus]
MRVFLCVCFAAAIVFTTDGQTDPDFERLCGGVLDFDLCKAEWNCNLNISRCFCKDETPFCRCNNFADEFYLGEDCSQKWTTLTFALVASLPGITLAFVVGLIVHIIHTCSGSGKSDGHVSKQQSSPPAEENLFPGMVFASDVAARPNGSTGPRPPQVGIPMQNTRPYSIPESPRPSTNRPPMGDPRQPYNPSASNRLSTDRPPMGGPRPSPDRPPMGGPRPTNSEFDRPALGGPPQPYSYTARPGQVLSNPYAKSRNPYEEDSPSPDSYRKYNPPASPQGFDDRRMGQSSAPSYSGSDYGNRGAFPRVQVNRMY